jgi:dUTP pyrophosphatase
MLFFVSLPLDHVPEGHAFAPEYWINAIRASHPEHTFFVPERGQDSRLIEVYHDVIRRAEGLVAIVPDEIHTYGTTGEMGYARALGKPVALICDHSLHESNLWLKQFPRYDLTTIGNWLSNLDGEWSEIQRPTLFFKRERHTTADLEPRKGYRDDAGFDLVVSNYTEIPGRQFVDVPLGVSVEFPPTHWGLLTGRSSTIRKKGLLVTNGIIDAGFRGPLFAGIQNLNMHDVHLQAGERIAQIIPFPVSGLDWQVLETDTLSGSERGTRGFGSTG